VGKGSMALWYKTGWQGKKNQTKVGTRMGMEEVKFWIREYRRENEIIGMIDTRRKIVLKNSNNDRKIRMKTCSKLQGR
jgi:hypothetical protein